MTNAAERKRGGRKRAVLQKTALMIDMSVWCDVKHQSFEKYTQMRIYLLSVETKTEDVSECGVSK